MASEINGNSIVCSTVNSGYRQRNIKGLYYFFIYGEQKNTRLCRVTMVAIFDSALCGANTFDQGSYINCNGTRY